MIYGLIEKSLPGLLARVGRGMIAGRLSAIRLEYVVIAASALVAAGSVALLLSGKRTRAARIVGALAILVAAGMAGRLSRPAASPPRPAPRVKAPDGAEAERIRKLAGAVEGFFWADVAESGRIAREPLLPEKARQPETTPPWPPATVLIGPRRDESSGRVEWRRVEPSGRGR